MVTAKLTAKRVEGRNLFVTASFIGGPVDAKEYKFSGFNTRDEVLATVSDDLAMWNHEAGKADRQNGAERLSQELEHDIVNGTLIDENGPVPPQPI